MTKRFFFALAALSLALPAICKTKKIEEPQKSLDELVGYCSLAEIKKAFKGDKSLAAQTVGESRDTPLMAAIGKGRDRKIVSWLLKSSDVDKPNALGQTAVSYVCAYSSDKKVIKKTLKKKSSRKKTRERLLRSDDSGKTAFENVFDNKSEKAKKIAVKYLTKKDRERFFEPGTDLRKKENFKHQAQPPAPPPEPPAESEPEETAAAFPPDLDEAFAGLGGAGKKTYLLDYETFDDETGADGKRPFIPDANKAGANGVTPLMAALKRGSEWEVDALIHSGADVNARDSDGWTPLMYGARWPNGGRAIEMLIDAGADIRARSGHGLTALSLAAQYCADPGTLEKLLGSYSFDEDETFKALTLAIRAPADPEIVRLSKIRLFIDKGVSLNRFWEGKTPLMYAAESCRSTEPIALLIENGAIVTARADDGRVAFDFAKQNSALPRDRTYWSLNRGR